MELRNFIDGKFIDSISKKNIPVLNPANQKIVGNIDEALDEEIGHNSGGLITIVLPTIQFCATIPENKETG